MNYIKTSLWALAAMTLVACSNDDDQQSTITPVSKSFSASIGDITRTTLSNDADNPYPIWSANDGLKVYNATTQSSADFTISSGVGSRAADFTGTINIDNEVENNKFYAFYCGNATGENAPQLVTTGETPQISATIPAEQPTTAGFHPELHFMTACTTGNAFKFKNAMSLLKVTISENNYENFGICRIRFKANNPDENIAGTFTATIADDGTLGDYTVTNGSNEIVIGDGTTALATGTYYIAILPCAFSQGFTLAFEDANDNNLKVYDRIKDTSFNVGKSEIINLDSYTAKECAKYAYVDLGITDSNKKVLWGIQNMYDEAGEAISGTNRTTTETSPNSSYYAWGETYIKSNQYKETATNNYSWYYTYGIGTGTDDGTVNKRSYKYGVGNGRLWDAWNSSNRWIFDTSTSGVLSKYNRHNGYKGSITDWTGGNQDNKQYLDAIDDVAYQKTSGLMRMPSWEQWNALIGQVGKTISVTKDESANVYKIENTTTHRYITLPIGGYRHKTSANDNQELKDANVCTYWGRNLTSGPSNTCYQARCYIISDGSITQTIDARCQGRMVRGIILR
jgi:hypothetical protein